MERKNKFAIERLHLIRAREETIILNHPLVILSVCLCRCNLRFLSMFALDLLQKRERAHFEAFLLHIERISMIQRQMMIVASVALPTFSAPPDMWDQSPVAIDANQIESAKYANRRCSSSYEMVQHIAFGSTSVHSGRAEVCEHVKAAVYDADQLSTLAMSQMFPVPDVQVVIDLGSDRGQLFERSDAETASAHGRGIVRLAFPRTIADAESCLETEAPSLPQDGSELFHNSLLQLARPVFECGIRFGLDRPRKWLRILAIALVIRFAEERQNCSVGIHLKVI